VQKDASPLQGYEWHGRHGDIKPENILWVQNNPECMENPGIVKITDLGLGRFHGPGLRSMASHQRTADPSWCKSAVPAWVERLVGILQAVLKALKRVNSRHGRCSQPVLPGMLIWATPAASEPSTYGSLTAGKKQDEVLSFVRVSPYDF
jgi:serine/threonine protein kinase